MPNHSFDPVALRAACITNSPEAMGGEFLKVRQAARIHPEVFATATQVMENLAQDMIDIGGDYKSALRIMHTLCLLARATEMPREPVIKAACLLARQIAPHQGIGTTELMVDLYNLSRRNAPLSAMVVETAIALISEPEILKAGMLSTPAFLMRGATANSSDMMQLDRYYTAVFKGIRNFLDFPSCQPALAGVPSLIFGTLATTSKKLDGYRCKKSAHATAAKFQRKLVQTGNNNDVRCMTSNRLELAGLPVPEKLPEPFVCRSFMAAQAPSDHVAVVIVFGVSPELTRVFGGYAPPKASGQSLSDFQKQVAVLYPQETSPEARVYAGILGAAIQVLAEPKAVRPFRKAARHYKKAVLQLHAA